MAAVTTNYGFDVPTSSDLVKNGATQIALLGQDIDTFLYRPFGVNVLNNGNLDIWQRGTSFVALGDGQYCADQWISTRNGSAPSLTLTQDTSVPNPNSEYSIKFLQTLTNTGVTQYAGRQFIEQNNLLPLLGKSCVISFWYRSNKTGSHGIRIFGAYNTGGTDQKTTFTVNTADTWEYKTIAVTAFAGVSAPSASPSAAGGLVDLGFRVDGQGFTSLAANDYFQFTQIKLEAGTTATPFTRAGGTIQGELAACQRYYWRNTAASNNVPYGGGYNESTTFSDFYIQFPQTMRTSPSAVEYSTLQVSDFATFGTDITNLVISASTSGPAGIILTSTVASGLTAQRVSFLRAKTAGTSYLGFSAEL
jgi:hypothetical protein